MKLRVLFMGSPAFSVPALRALAAEFELVGVITQPDKPTGRGQKDRPTSVKAAAAELGLPTASPADVCSEECMSFIRECNPEVIVVAAFGAILPENILNIPRLGCVNLHASLLPRHRGAAPINAAIMEGDKAAGVCTILMNKRMDTGDVLLSEEIPISDQDTAGSLSDKMSEPGARLLVETLRRASTGTLQRHPQDNARATYTRLLSKDDGLIDWRRDAVEISRLVRAVNPWPGALTKFRGENLKIWEAVPEEGIGPCGAVIAVNRDGILVGTGSGLLRLITVQAPGRNRIRAADFARGKRLPAGEVLE